MYNLNREVRAKCCGPLVSPFGVSLAASMSRNQADGATLRPMSAMTYFSFSSPRRSELPLPALPPFRNHCSFRLPQIVEPVRRRPCVMRCVSGISVAEVVLNDSQIAALVGQREAAGMA